MGQEQGRMRRLRRQESLEAEAAAAQGKSPAKALTRGQVSFGKSSSSNTAPPLDSLPQTVEDVPEVKEPEPQFRFTDRSLIPDELVQGPFEDLEIAADVYTTAYLVARSATPDMYSFWPWRNPDVRIVWAYGLFVICSQVFAICMITFMFPPSVRQESAFVNCANATSVAEVYRRGFLPSRLEADCLEEGEIAFESAHHGTFRKVEQEFFYYQQILVSGTSSVYLLQLICCMWVFSTIFFQEFENVRNLIAYHDFSRWFMRVKGEQVSNEWVIVIPFIQYAVLLVVLTVSMVIICGQTEPFDIVMNSLAFTFIAEVGKNFNAPLAKEMGNREIKGLDASYGIVNYLYPEIKESNCINPDGTYVDEGWYILEEEMKAGLIGDYKVRHNEAMYPKPFRVVITCLEVALVVVPVLVVFIGALGCKGLLPWPARLSRVEL